jgi:hypothetical protein
VFGDQLLPCGRGREVGVSSLPEGQVLVDEGVLLNRDAMAAYLTACISTVSGAHNRWHPGIPPAVWVKPGDEFRVECREWTDAQIGNNNSADDIRDVELDGCHMLSEPIGVEGAEPGDLLIVDILDRGPCQAPQEYGDAPGQGWGYTGIFAKVNSPSTTVARGLVSPVRRRRQVQVATYLNWKIISTLFGRISAAPNRISRSQKASESEISNWLP